MKRLYLKETGGFIEAPQDTQKLFIDETGNLVVINGTQSNIIVDNTIEYCVSFYAIDEFISLEETRYRIDQIQKSTGIDTYEFGISGVTYSNASLPVIIDQGTEIKWKITYAGVSEIGALSVVGSKI